MGATVWPWGMQGPQFFEAPNPSKSRKGLGLGRHRLLADQTGTNPGRAGWDGSRRLLVQLRHASLFLAGAIMTTKRFLLDLLDAKESQLRDGTDNDLRKVREYAGDHGSTLASWKQIQLATVEKARRLVEKGPDE